MYFAAKMSLVSSLFKALTFCNTLRPNATAPIYQLQLRCFHLGQPIHRKSRKTAEEEVGLPRKPKRPISALFLYMLDVRPTIKANNPKLNLLETNALMHKMYNSLDDTKKQKYVNEANERHMKYLSMLVEYRKNLTDDDKRKIKEMKLVMKERNVALLHKKKMKQLGRPKKPPPAFIKFMLEQNDYAGKQVGGHTRSMALKWNALSDVEKEKYKLSDADKENYRKALCEWESKMIRLGHFDVVSVKNQFAKNVPRTRWRKKSSSE